MGAGVHARCQQGPAVSCSTHATRGAESTATPAHNSHVMAPERRMQHDLPRGVPGGSFAAAPRWGTKNHVPGFVEDHDDTMTAHDGN
jgi:hypothetical protein